MSGALYDDPSAHAALAAFEAHQPGLPIHGQLRAGAAVPVQRLDREESYLLVPLRDTTGMRGIVQLDAGGQDVESVAVVRDAKKPFLLSAEEAMSAAQTALPNAREWGAPYLGWKPCRESFDSLMPLWVIPHATGHAFVTQVGRVFVALTAGRGGG
jgi:hypothetical protein